MRKAVLAGVLILCGNAVAAQEREPPKDSARVTINGCAKDRTFIVGERREDQPGTLEIEPGSRFRLNGPKKLLDDIKKHQRSVVQVTGLVRKADINGPKGLSVLGGRVRIGGARPQDPLGDAARDPSYNQAIIDIESWTELPGSCPAR